MTNPYLPDLSMVGAVVWFAIFVAIVAVAIHDALRNRHKKLIRLRKVTLKDLANHCRITECNNCNLWQDDSCPGSLKAPLLKISEEQMNLRVNIHRNTGAFSHEE